MMTNFLWSRLPGLGTTSDLIPQGCFSRWPVSVHRLVGGCCHDMCISVEPSHHHAHRPLVGGCSTSLIYHRTNHDSMIICYMVSELGPSNALSSNPRYWNLRPRAYNWIVPNPGRADEEDMAHTNALIRTGSAVSQTGNDMQQMSVKNATNVCEKCNNQWKKKYHADPCNKCHDARRHSMLSPTEWMHKHMRTYYKALKCKHHWTCHGPMEIIAPRLPCSSK